MIIYFTVLAAVSVAVRGHELVHIRPDLSAKLTRNDVLRTAKRLRHCGAYRTHASVFAAEAFGGYSGFIHAFAGRLPRLIKAHMTCVHRAVGEHSAWVHHAVPAQPERAFACNARGVTALAAGLVRRYVL